MVEINQDVIKERLETVSRQLEEADNRLLEIRKEIRSAIREVVGEILEESKEKLTPVLGDDLEERLYRRIEKKADEFLRNLSIEITVS